MAQTLRDFASQYNLPIEYDSKTKRVKLGNLSFTSGQGQELGIELQGNSNMVTDPSKLLKSLQAKQNEVETQGLPAASSTFTGYQGPSSNDIVKQMQSFYKKQEQAQLRNLLNQLSEVIRSLEGQRDNVTMAANQQRTQADINAQMDAQRLRATLANMGLIGNTRSGQAVTENERVQNNLQRNLSRIGQNEMAQQNDISQRIADLRLASGNDIAAMQSALAAEQAQALWNQMNADRSFGYQMGRDQIGDQRYQQEWDWQTSPNNPSYQAQMLQNQIRQLELQNLPEVQKLELQRLKQQIQAGQIDAATAQERLRQLKNPPQVEAPTEDLSKQVNTYYSSIEKLFDRSDATKYPFGEAGDRAWQADVGTYLTNLRSSGVSDDVIIEIMRRLGLPFKYDD